MAIPAGPVIVSMGVLFFLSGLLVNLIQTFFLLNDRRKRESSSNRVPTSKKVESEANSTVRKVWSQSQTRSSLSPKPSPYPKIQILLPKRNQATQLAKWFRQRRKKPMLEALEKIKAELVVLGFISLLLTFGQHYIANICSPIKLADTMLPCPMKHPPQHHGPELNLPDELNAPHEPKHVPDEHNLPLEPKHEPEHVTEHHRRLLWYEHRFLAGDSPASGCKKKRWSRH